MAQEIIYFYYRSLLKLRKTGDSRSAKQKEGQQRLQKENESEGEVSLEVSEPDKCQGNGESPQTDEPGWLQSMDFVRSWTQLKQLNTCA